MKKVDINNLYPHSAMTKSQYFDFDEHKKEWELPFLLTDNEAKHKEYDPGMNYLYPLDEFYTDIDAWTASELKEALEKSGHITLIKIPGSYEGILNYEEDKYYLALRGGGQDLTWDICAGYVNFGYLPPIDFCERLPDLAGMDMTNERQKMVLLACERSAQYVKERGNKALTNLQKFVDKAYDLKWTWKK
jgi:hypothetical protein